MAAAPQFQILGVPIRVELWFPVVLVVLALTAYQGPLVVSFVAVAALSVLIHELGHALAYRHYGIQPRIVLHGMGGLTFGTGTLSPGRSILVTLAGPVPPLVLFGLPALLFRSSAHLTGDVDQLLWQIVYINVGWSLLNLIPMLPLDGGNVCASALELAFRGHGRQIANVISLVLAGALLVVGLAWASIFLLFIAGFFAVMNVMELARREPPVPAADALVEAHRALLTGHPGQAEHLAQEGVANARTPDEERWGRELMAWSRLLAGDVHGAQQVAATMGMAQPASQSFYGSLALAMGRHDEGVTVLTWAFVREPAGPAKSLAALMAARVGVVDTLTAELLAMGGTEGPRAAELLAQLVEYGRAVWSAPQAVPPGPPVSQAPVPMPGPDAKSGVPGSAPPPGPWASPGPDAKSGVPGSASPPSAPLPPAEAWPTEPPEAPPSAWTRPGDHTS